MRVLFYTTSLGRGGAESHLVRLVNELSSGDDPIDVEIAVLYPGEYAERLPNGVPLHVFGREGGSVTFALTRSVRPLRELILSSRPDIVCSIMDMPGLFAYRALLGLDTPPAFVTSVQNPPLLRYETDRPSLTAVSNGYARLRLALTRRLYRGADALIAISKGVKADIARLSPESESKTHVVYNAGVDDTVLESAQAGFLDQTSRPSPLVVACGRLVHQKGFDVLIDAFLSVRDRADGATLWILGQGPLRPLLEAQVSRLGLDDAVVFQGFQSNPFSFMAAADVFVLSSRFEGFGNVVAEAMACGTATVATDCPYGPGEIIENGTSGVLVPVEDREALADALCQVLADAELRSQLARAGRERARAFSAEGSAEAHRRLFQLVAKTSV